MTYPRLIIRRSIFAANAETVCRRCSAHGISVTGVTKGFCAAPPLVRCLVEAGAVSLADSSLANIAALKREGFSLPIYMLRIPMISELPELVQWADGSLVSGCETIEALEQACASARRAHEVLVMFELGDLREGFWPWELERIAASLKRAPHLILAGVGANFGCYGATVPTPDKLLFLGEIRKELARLTGREIRTCSGGSTSSLELLEGGRLPECVDNLRVGEGIALGTDVVRGTAIPWLRQDTMTAEAEIVEVRRKPSVPFGVTSLTAFGERPYFEDRGERLRALAALGRQNVKHDDLTPLDEGVEILGASSDHMILDVEAMPAPPRVGDVLRFRPGYGAMLMLGTSPYVEKVFE